MIAGASRMLPLLLEPIEDETLLSFCRRLAARNEASLTCVLRTCGLVAERGPVVMAPEHSLVLEPPVLDAVTFATGITSDSASRLVLSCYRGAINLGDYPRSDPAR